MMKKYRILSLALALLMLLSLLAGCSSNNDNEQATDTAATETPAEADETATPEGEDEGAEAAELDGEVLIGLLAPLTGDAAQYGNAVVNGAKLYIDQYNAKGGLQILTEQYDEEGDESKAITGYNSLVDRGVAAIIGDVTSAPTQAVVPEAYEDNMPMISASATAEGVTYDAEADTVYSNMFRVCFIDPFQGEKMASFAVEELEVSTAAILYNNGSDYSIGLMEAFVEKAGELGLEIVATEVFTDDTVDFQSQLTNIASADPDVLFIPYYYENVALLAPQAANVGLDAIMLGSDGWDTVLSSMDDPSSVEGAYYCSGYSVQDESEAVQQFLSDYEAAYGDTPNMFAAQGYDAAMILIDAIEKAVADGIEIGTDEFSTAVINYMSATDMDCVTGNITFDEYNNPQKTAAIINIKDGEAAFWGNY